VGGTHDALRLVDANLDRASEGIRVAEDLVRFLADDEAGSGRLREMRHRLWEAAAGIPAGSGRLLEARDSGGDTGREQAPGKQAGGGSAALFRANLHRFQEACRVLEEAGGACGVDTAAVNRLRFEAYDAEKVLYPVLRARDLRRKLDFSLYVVTDPGLSRGRSTVEVVRAAIEGGAGAIQLRAKEMSTRDLLDAARELRGVTLEAGVTFIVNDRADVALAAGADGVHVGQEDLPVADARRLLGPDMIVGASCHSLPEARRAEEEGADYVNIGPVFATSTKAHGSPPVGPGLITEVRDVLQCPLTSMGGINSSNVDRVVLAGADRVAVVSAVVTADDVAAAARDLVRRIEEAKKRRDRARGGEETDDAMVS